MTFVTKNPAHATNTGRGCLSRHGAYLQSGAQHIVKYPVIGRYK